MAAAGCWRMAIGANSCEVLVAGAKQLRRNRGYSRTVEAGGGTAEARRRTMTASAWTSRIVAVASTREQRLAERLDYAHNLTDVQAEAGCCMYLSKGWSHVALAVPGTKWEAPCRSTLQTGRCWNSRSFE